jgi:hypothetical protein
MKTIYKTVLFMTLAVAMYSCASGPSLQKYYIDKQEDENFIAIDLPASIISLKDNVAPEVQEALSSLKKLNVLAFKKTKNNASAYKLEEQKVKTILNNDSFIELMRIKDKGRNIILKYEGNDDTIDEVIVYASDKNQGFALVRVLGENMEPAKIMSLVKNIQDINSDGLKQLKGFLK